MAESKKFWYIQLNVNFFEDERIDWLCEQKNGYAYVVLYLKLCLKTANNNGILTRQIGDMIIPYNVDKIAEITHIDVDIVRVALELYKRIGLVYEADENCNFMRLPEVPGMVGYTTQAAIEKARQREQKKQLESGQLPDKCPDNVRTNVRTLSGQCPDKCPDNVQDNVQQELRVKSKELRDNNLEIEIEIEEKDMYATKSQSHLRIPYQKVFDLYSAICVSYPPLNALSNTRKKAIAARFRSGRTLNDFEEMFRRAETSSFMKGKNKHNWVADFDWMLKDANMTKILEGKYDPKPISASAEEEGFSFYDLACRLDEMEEMQ